MTEHTRPHCCPKGHDAGWVDDTTFGDPGDLERRVCRACGTPWLVRHTTDGTTIVVRDPADATPDVVIAGTGTTETISPDAAKVASDRLHRLVEYGMKSSTHVWVLSLMHSVGDAALDALHDPHGVVDVDHESLLMAPMVGCFVCEQSYTPRLRTRRCPGRPVAH